MDKKRINEICGFVDKGIKDKVKLLLENGVETYESCEGGTGHAYFEPTVRFHGERAEGFRALSVAMTHRLGVRELKRVWVINDGEPTGAWWEMVFIPTK
ncbi:MAG: hypothetical protein H0W58_02120 [Acidobacteria bacterium]|jgi:hypothetical protein|nr:hypothetical protein [Acidobacteriota bacterium]